LAQTYTNWECIVVDDGSTDDTPRILAEYCAKDARFQYHHRPEDRLPGGNAARNYGFELSKGEYIQWFDSDDIMMPEKIGFSFDKMSETKKDLIISNYSTFGKGKAKIRKNLEIDDLLKYHIAYGTINTQMCFFRRNKIENILFDETFTRCQEFDFFSRLFASGELSFSIINRSLCEIRVHDHSITGNYMSGDIKHVESTLISKYYAYECSLKYDEKTQIVTMKKFKRALWKAFVFKHRNLYWDYLKLFFKQRQTLKLPRKIEYVFMGIIYFNLCRGERYFKKRFFYD